MLFFSIRHILSGNNLSAPNLYAIDKHITQGYNKSELKRYIVLTQVLSSAEVITMLNAHHKRHFFIRPGHGRPFRRGDFKHIILQHLKDKPSYGYEIIRALQERFHSFYIPSPGTVYPTLQMLEEMGYVTAAEQEGKKVYTITEEGRQFLDEQKESGGRIRSQMKSWWNPANIDGISEVMREFDSLADLLRDKARTAGTKKLSRIRQALSRAYEEISKD
jgi:DNA-binding PadR family transcriptional regulator